MHVSAGQNNMLDHRYQMSCFRASWCCIYTGAHFDRVARDSTSRKRAGVVIPEALHYCSLSFDGVLDMATKLTAACHTRPPLRRTLLLPPLLRPGTAGTRTQDRSCWTRPQ